MRHLKDMFERCEMEGMSFEHLLVEFAKCYGHIELSFQDNSWLVKCDDFPVGKWGDTPRHAVEHLIERLEI